MTPQELTARFDAHPAELAPLLLGCALSVTTARGTVTVRLTEVEAYGGEGEDPGSHAHRGRTMRNTTMFGAPRHAYLYQSYGIHTCLNLVADAESAGGVLLRAGEVIAGRTLAVDRRGGKDTGAKLLSGPGRLGQGLGCTLPMDGSPVEIITTAPDQSPPAAEVGFWLSPPAPPPPAPARTIRSGPRTGVSGIGGSAQYPWRFWLEGQKSVSAYRPGKNVPSVDQPSVTSR